MRGKKVVNILQNVCPFDSPRDDHEGADKGCSSPDVPGWLVTNAVAGIPRKQQKEQQPWSRFSFSLLGTSE